MDDAFHLSAVVLYAENEDAQGGFISLRIYRLCGSSGKYGQIFSRRAAAHFGARHLYPGTGRGTDHGQMGERDLYQYLDRTVL